MKLTINSVLNFTIMISCKGLRLMMKWQILTDDACFIGCNHFATFAYPCTEWHCVYARADVAGWDMALYSCFVGEAAGLLYGESCTTDWGTGIYWFTPGCWTHIMPGNFTLVIATQKNTTISSLSSNLVRNIFSLSVCLYICLSLPPFACFETCGQYFVCGFSVPEDVF
jgi:hypothetical protein